MTLFLRNGNSFLPRSERALDLYPKLPVGNYIVKVNPDTGDMYYEQVESFEEMGKIYGKIPRLCTRILNTFSDREKSTGALLTGEKGSGKTLLARLVSITAAKEGIPTIIINMPYRGDVFNKFIQDLTQPAIILFDEFEKVYDREKQEEILTLFDGVFPTKKLFIVTCNDKFRVDGHMRNRPGRMFYMFEFEGVDAEFITEYCEERLNDKSHIPTINRISTLFSAFNFDMLKAMVEEMNRYHETPHQVLDLLNAKPFTDEVGHYNVTLSVDNVFIETSNYHPTTWRGNPVACQDIELTYYEPKLPKKKKDADDEISSDYTPKEYHIRPSQLRHIDSDGSAYTYILDDRTKVTFTKARMNPVDYKALGF